MNYTTFVTGEGTGAGFNPVGPENPAGTVMIYVIMDDIEGDLRCMGELGRSVVSPEIEITDTGWFAIFKDPTGNVLALFTPMKI